MKILKDVGVAIDNGKDQLKASAKNFPLEVFYLRNGDIPQYLKDGVVDVAIIGENVLLLNISSPIILPYNIYPVLNPFSTDLST